MNVKIAALNVDCSGEIGERKVRGCQAGVFSREISPGSRSLSRQKRRDRETRHDIELLCYNMVGREEFCDGKKTNKDQASREAKRPGAMVSAVLCSASSSSA